MPDYQQPLSLAGGLAGSASGGLLGRLGDLLEPLDYPRQALYNLGRTVGRGVSGQATADDWASAAPGALGAALAGGLMATGVGAPLGILAGSALGGLGQGVGKAVSPDAFQAPTPHDLAAKLTGDEESELNPALGTALGVLSDPLTYAGGLGGAAAGGKYGQRLENIANWRGPRYGGGVEKLADVIANHPRSEEHIARILNHPDLASVLSEVPEGSKYLGAGVETMALHTPAGRVVTIGHDPSSLSLRGPMSPPAPRPDLAEVLQAARSKPFGVPEELQRLQEPLADTLETNAQRSVPLRVEHLPMADVAGRMPYERFREINDARAGLKEKLAGQGYNFGDHHAGNFGQMPNGEWKVIDAGAVVPAQGHSFPPTPEQLSPAPGTSLEHWLLDRLGADQSVRNEIEARLAGMAGPGHPVDPFHEALRAQTALPAGKSPLDELGTADLGMPGRRRAVSRMAP